MTWTLHHPEVDPFGFSPHTGFFPSEDVIDSFFGVETDREVEKARGLDFANEGRVSFIDFVHIGAELEGAVVFHRLQFVSLIFLLWMRVTHVAILHVVRNESTPAASDDISVHPTISNLLRKYVVIFLAGFRTPW